MSRSERVALHPRELVDELKAGQGIGRWLARYKNRRAHSVLAERTLRMAYEGIPMPPLKAA